MRDLRKDVDLALTLFSGSEAQTPLTRWSSERVEGEAARTPDLDISAVARLYRQVPEPPIAESVTATQLAAAYSR